MRGTILSVLLALGAAAAIAAVAVAGNHEPKHGPPTTAVSGSFSLNNTREAMPVFSAANIGPGDSARGTVTIGNEGEEEIAVTLAEHDLLDTPGAGGGVLSQRLALRVEDLSAARSVYAGPLAAMQPRSLGRLAPSASREYEFVATLPESGASAAAENALQDSSTSVAFSWTATAASPGEPAPEGGEDGGGPSGQVRADATSAPPPVAPHFRVHIVRYRPTLRNGRLIVWVRCNQPCRVRSRARFRAPGHLGALRPTARHAQRRRFGARTRRLALRVAGSHWRLRPAAGPVTVRLVVLARNRGGERASAAKLLRLRAAR
ncbi:MAG TPA: hypothetical protein VG898_03795 [Solirubrobacterales bacterium]|nr:hypothetical protein [Solirubrobacterales bacterium]